MKRRWITWGMVGIVLSLAPGPVGAWPRLADRHQPPPVVVRADVDRLEPDRLVIHGANFGSTTAPTVLLATVPLQVLSFSDEQIVVKLPIDAPPARYRLQVLAPGRPPSAVVEVVLGSAARPSPTRSGG